METIDDSILERGYSVYRTETGRYFGMYKDEVKRVHIQSNGRPNYQLDDSITASVVELIKLPDNKIVQLDDIVLTIPANQLTPVPVEINLE